MLAMATRDAMGEVGSNGSVMLGRSAWAGTQRFGAAVWSGDTDSSWKALNGQVRAALNMGMSGIVYWTSDIGGYAGGGGGPQHMGFNHNIHSPEYLQLLTRWFQFGVMCPLFRSHGHRLPELAPVSCDGSDAGGFNEVWHFPEPYRSAIVKVMRPPLYLLSLLPSLTSPLSAHIFAGPADTTKNDHRPHKVMRLRESLRPYIDGLYAEAASSGAPVVRMLRYE